MAKKGITIIVSGIICNITNNYINTSINNILTPLTGCNYIDKEKMSNSHVYVITSQLGGPDYFKIGKCSVSRKTLRKRFTTGVIEIDIKIFHRCVNNTRVENYLHLLLSDYRVRRRCSGTYSEWFTCDSGCFRQD